VAQFLLKLEEGSPARGASLRHKSASLGLRGSGVRLRRPRAQRQRQPQPPPLTPSA
jgi:hypothetical protein